MPDMKAFTELVRKMREAQKQYFRSRDRHDLSHSKHLEKQVDTVLEELCTSTTQVKLF